MKRYYPNQRPVHCPVCLKGRVIDISASMDRSRLMLYGPRQSQEAQFYSKCPKCGLQIGISVS